MSPFRKETKIVKGISASEGIVSGHCVVLHRARISVSLRKLREEEVEREIARLKEAIKEAKAELEGIRREAELSEARESLFVIDAHIMILEDELLIGETVKKIKEEKVNAEWALRKVIDELVASFNQIKDPYLRERGRDVEVVGERILGRLVGHRESGLIDLKEPLIVVAHDLTPEETTRLSMAKVLGFATDIGSATSHTSIVARSLELPAVVGLENITELVEGGELLILDGIEGVVVINPGPELCEEYAKKKARWDYMTGELRKYVELESVTSDNHRVRLAANLEFLEEVRYLKQYGAEGIGLYRTEYIYLERDSLPTEDEHFENYKGIVTKAYPLYVTIRTLDMGGDKLVPSLSGVPEKNPAMGLRGIRFCLKEKEIFKAQLRGILRASAFGKVRIMFPLVSELEELLEAKRMVKELMDELREKSIEFDPAIQIGVMVEVPSAALLADELAKEVDFFSIGTNDLIQYLMAIDRVNEQVSYLYRPFHPSVLWTLKKIIDAGHKANIEVDLCGELSSDPLYLPVLVGMGIDELSMPARFIPRMRKILRGIEKSKAEELVSELFKFRTHESIREFVEEWIKREWSSAYSLEFSSPFISGEGFHCKETAN